MLPLGTVFDAVINAWGPCICTRSCMCACLWLTFRSKRQRERYSPYITLLSASFLTATKECVEHPHVQAPMQCESRRVEEKKIWGSRDNAEGESSRLCVCLSMGAWAREEEVSMREIRESLKWDDEDRKAQIDIAITKKTSLQLRIHLHTLGVRWLTNHWLHSISLINTKGSSQGSHCAQANNLQVAYSAWERNVDNLNVQAQRRAKADRQTEQVWRLVGWNVIPRS